VFADCLQDALDIAADATKLDSFLIADCDREDYLDNETGDWNDSVELLGNYGEPFDIENVDFVELPNPKFSFVAQFCASNADKSVLV
jgi:hypothetical protein